MNELERNSKNYIGYEYKELMTDSSKASQYLDGYDAFGWIPDENAQQPKDSGKIKLQLKRDRKIANKTELTRLQRHFEDCMDRIETLERSRTTRATAIALLVGILGTACMAGSTFAVVHEPPVIWLCILLAIPGFAGWIGPYFIYRSMVRKRTAVVSTLIEGVYDEIHGICEKGSHLLEH